MFETKPLTNADHFVRPIQRVAALRRELARPSTESVVVTISPAALALLAAAQAQQAGAAEKGDRADKSFKRKLGDLLAGLDGDRD